MRSRAERAEEAAFNYQLELGMIDSVSDEHIVARRMEFKDGYKQAEKELELTWEDIEKITDIHHNVLYNNPKRIMGAKENYEDTLREFNEWREKNRATKNN